MAEWLDILQASLAPSLGASLTEWGVRLFVIVVIVVTAGAILNFLIVYLIGQAAKTSTNWDDVLLQSIRRPLTLLIWIVGLTYAAELSWSTSDSSDRLALASNLRTLGVTFCFIMFLLRFLNLGEAVFLRRKEERNEQVDRAGVRAINKILKASVIITGILMVLNTMGYSISGALAFGGIGGLAVGFAAKDLLANFFGGLMIYLDRPFAEGDWIRSPDREFEGIVEHIGWRQTRIRSFAHYPLYVPNSIFTQVAIENPARMDARRIREVVGVRYDDMGKVANIVSEIKEILKADPEINSDKTMIVSLNEFSASSVDIMIYTFTKTTQWMHYHEVKQAVMLKVAEIIERHGAEIAFPTRTVHQPDDTAV